MQAAIWGTPDRILRALEARREVVGDFELNVAFRFGGMSAIWLGEHMVMFPQCNVQ